MPTFKPGGECKQECNVGGELMMIVKSGGYHIRHALSMVKNNTNKKWFWKAFNYKNCDKTFLKIILRLKNC